MILTSERQKKEQHNNANNGNDVLRTFYSFGKKVCLRVYFDRL